MSLESLSVSSKAYMEELRPFNMVQGVKGNAMNSFADLSCNKSCHQAIFDENDELSQIKISDFSGSQSPSRNYLPPKLLEIKQSAELEKSNKEPPQNVLKYDCPISF